MITYPFKTTPFKHQMDVLSKSWEREEYALFMEMGTGKTKVSIDNVAMLYDAGLINGMLITAPKGVYRNWTEKEIPVHLPDHIPTRIAYWRAGPRKPEKAAINRLFEPNDDLCILAINIEAFATKVGPSLAHKFLLARKVLFIVDESTAIKTPSAKRTKEVVKLGPFARYRRILTGSPVTRSPLDLFSQCEFLNPNLLGFRNYYAFRARYAVLKNMNFGGRSVKTVVGHQNVEELAELIKDFSYRVTKDDCLDLPDKIYTLREIELTKEQKDAYEEMRYTALAFIQENVSSVTSVITQLLRLHQITCGHLKMDDGTEVELPNNRLKELMDVLSETSGKVIIWANYRYDIKSILGAVRKEYGEESIVDFFGDTTSEDRISALTEFQDPESPVRFFLSNPQTGGYGNTLTQANTVVYYSNNYDLEKRLQSEDRAHRIGQEDHVLYVDIVAKGTVDEKIIDSLRRKVDIARTITGDNYRDWI